MPRALCIIRNILNSDRRSYYLKGLKRAGYEISDNLAGRPDPDDVLLIWNRHGMQNQHAARFEHCGAHVVVTENGWIGRAEDGGKLYALCRGHHNGPGQWRSGSPDRWKKFGIELAPWRKQGDHILVLPQRGIGEPGVAMPHDWLPKVLVRLASATRRPIVVRKHPGEKKADISADLKGAHAVVTWGSGAAIKAIAAGVPAFYDLHNWIGADAARRGVASIEEPFLGDREPMFERLAWAQWSVPEIESGEAFKWLLS